MDFWREHVGAWLASGESAAAYAESHGLTVQGLKWWRWKLGTLAPATSSRAKAKALSPVKSAPTFVEVVPRQDPASALRFELRLRCGWQIAFDSGVDVDELRRVACALEQA